MKKLKERVKNKLGEKRTASLRKVLKVVRIVKNIICWALIAVLTLAIIIFMITKASGDTPSVFGYSIHRIVSGSMEPELSVGDVILNKEVSDSSEVKVGNIITFQGSAAFDNKIVTHRVLVAPYDNGRGTTVLVTKGDANEKDDGEINFSDVQSKFVAKVSFLKNIYDFFFSKWGLLVFVFLLLLIFFDEIVNIIKVSIYSSEQDDTESIQEIVERVKREQLEEAKRRNNLENTSQNTSPDSNEQEQINIDQINEDSDNNINRSDTKESSKNESNLTAHDKEQSKEQNSEQLTQESKSGDLMNRDKNKIESTSRLKKEIKEAK